MKRSNRHSQGFSLPEVLIASSLLFTFATLSVGSYRDHVQHEQIKASRASAQAWLEDVSRIAQQFNTHCLVQVNLTDQTLEARADNPAACEVPAPHEFSSSICVVKDRNVDHDELRCKDAEDDTSIEITPRGTAVVGQELEFGNSDINTKRCLLVSEPLGLIRSGIRISASATDMNQAMSTSSCDYGLAS